jgi:Cu(I)/Ag(I) efflux system membrane fusion protein
MAFNNRGADWLQNQTGVENPYFGSAMFRCGDQVEIITTQVSEK